MAYLFPWSFLYFIITYRVVTKPNKMATDSFCQLVPLYAHVRWAIKRLPCMSIKCQISSWIIVRLSIFFFPGWYDTISLFLPLRNEHSRMATRASWRNFEFPEFSPRSMSLACGRWEQGMFLYTASRIFSFTWVMVSQLSTLTTISGLFSLSAFTQPSVWPDDTERRKEAAVTLPG